MRELSYASALREAHAQCLAADPSVLVMGLGVPDPKGIFGTTVGLQQEFGPERVFDTPLSENAMTGVAIGLAVTGMRPIMIHQRADFALVSVEQIINQAAKWHYIFDGQHCVPLVIRMVIGRGWGQGAQHAQSLQALYAHIPGLKVVMPATTGDAKGMLIDAVEDDNPVIFIEHRWLHGVTGDVPEPMYRVPIGRARIAREGADVTLVGLSYMVLECLKAAELLAEKGIGAEVVDLRSLRPFDRDTIVESVRKTGRLVVADTANLLYGCSAEVIASVTERCFGDLHAAPTRVGSPEHPAPTSPALAKGFYARAAEVAEAAMRQFSEGPDPAWFEDAPGQSLDQPNRDFTGPF